MKSPPASVHFAVATQTPGAPPFPVQGPFSSERRTPLKVADERVERRRRERREVVCMFRVGKGKF